MTDYTRADLEQNARLDQLENDLALAKRQLSNQAGKLRELAPLTGLIEFVETIKAHFGNLRLK